MSTLRRLPWGPALSSASGAPETALPRVNAFERVPRSLVRLPPEVRLPFRVSVDGIPQEEGVDYFLAGRLLVFTRDLGRDGVARGWRRIRGPRTRGGRRRGGSVSVAFEGEDGGRTRVLHGLAVVRYGAAHGRR